MAANETRPMLIRDPVHDLISFDDTACDRLLLGLIQTREFQRLRRIKQLGMSELVFPGSNHSRLAHSLGVLQMARLFLNRLDRVSNVVTDDRRTVVLAAALLHDLGHGPFSHAFEKITNESHERRTEEIIRDDSTEVHRALVSHSAEMPQRLCLFFDEDVGAGGRDRADIPAVLKQVISSQLDADRFDYLIRDSHATGAGYGRFDYRWLIEHLNFEAVRGRLYLSHKALLPAEEYVFARYHMYRMVYFHKTTRAAEVMLRLVFQRFRQLINETGPEQIRSTVTGAPAVMYNAFHRALTLSEYLALDDHTVTEFLKASSKSGDSVLCELSSGLLNRRLFKATDVTEADGYDSQAFREQCEAIVRDAGQDPAYSFVSDRAADTAYKPYDPDPAGQPSHIYVQTPHSGIREITNVSKSLEALSRRYVLMRYYYPEHVRDRIRGAASTTLRSA